MNVRQELRVHIVDRAKTDLLGLLGRRLREGKTIKGFAGQLGWTEEEVADVVLGNGPPSSGKIAELMRALEQ